MRPLTQITPDTTVRQVAATWPACARLLSAYPGARWNGRWTLQDLAYFARSCGIDQEDLLERLAQAAGVQVGPPGSSARHAPAIPVILVALAVTLTLGAGWGVALLLRIATGVDYATVSSASVHVHGVAQLWGWMTLFIFAVATHLLRQNTSRPAPVWLERAATAIIVAAIAMFFAGLSARVRQALALIDVLGSIGLLLAAILLSVCVIWTLSGAAASQRRHGFVFLVGWLVAWAASDLWLRVRYLSAPVLPDSARTWLIVLPVLGLATNAIYGFGIRLIPGLLNIAPLRHRFFAASLVLHNAGLCLFLVPRRAARTAGAALMVVACLAYLIGMNGLRSKPSRPIHGIDVRGHILIRVGFFWLVCGLMMVLAEQLCPPLPHAYSGAWRHALTVGFVTTMIMGVGYRIVPIFIKQPLASTRIMLLSAAFIIAGNAGRVTLELGTIGGWPWAFRLMGLTGILELAALTLFAVNLALTVRNRRRIYDARQPLTPDVRVREAVNARPEIQQRLAEIGVTMFDDAPFIAPSMTFGALALASGSEPRDLLKRLTIHDPPKAPSPAGV